MSDPLFPREESRFNVPLPTLGGLQFWTDHRWSDWWRVQQNAITGHWRTIDSHNVRRAWGSKEACVHALPPWPSSKQVSDHAVILLHGLMRTSRCMSVLGDDIAAANAGLPVRFEYASTRAAVAYHAAALREVVENLPGQPAISFVGHSLGNIVVRHALGDWRLDDPRNVLGRLNRVVMLGPPNQGAEIARRLSRLGLFEIITGKSGMELGPAWNSLQAKLAIPPCPCAVIAGDISHATLQNPLIEGPGDFVVCVDEARLEGAELLVVPVLHSFLMDNPVVREATVRFLRGEPLEPA